MNEVELRREARAFFEEFEAAFRTFRGTHISRRYRAPYVAMNAEGSLRCFPTDEAIGEYFQGVVDTYHRDGCRFCRHRNLDVVPIGEQCVLAAVTWDLLRDDGGVLSSWRESYLLSRIDGSLRVVASVDHPNVQT